MRKLENSHTAVYFERLSFVLGHFLRSSCAKHMLVAKSNFLKKRPSTLALGTFSISETNRIKDNTVYIRYISINLDKKFNRKKSKVNIFLGTKHREQEVY